MQPHFSIPPLTEEGVQKLVGCRCCVPVMSNYNKRWWVTIKSIRYVNEREAVVRIEGHRRFGNNKDVALSMLRFKGHIEDPLVQQIAKARWERKK